MLGRDDILSRLKEDGGLEIFPLTRGTIQAASVDVTMDDVFLVPRKRVPGPVLLGGDSIKEQMEERMREESVAGRHYRLDIGALILASTREYFKMPPTMSGQVVAKSSLARLGIAAPFGVGFIDPGFEGNLTIWMKNLGPWPILIQSGVKIAQVLLFDLNTPSSVPYSGKYQGQVGATASRTEVTGKPKARSQLLSVPRVVADEGSEA